MKKQFSLLAVCLCGIGLANAQTTPPTSPKTSPDSSYTSPMTTDSTSSQNSATQSSPMMNSNSMNNNGTTTTTSTETYSTTDRPARTKAKDYKNFVFGIYAGLNSTKFKGESVNTSGDISGRIGYQAGFFVRGGGRLFGQIGGEYFASSSNYFTKGDGQSAASIQDQINIQYVQIPLYIGYKLLQSDRGLSAIRLQVGLEYANRISSSSGKFNLTNAEIKSGTFNALAQLGFDIGPLLIDLTYHHGLSDSITNPTNGSTTTTGFAGSQRRILSASVGFKF